MKEYEPITIQSTLDGTLPRVPFGAIKEAILGKRFDLSLALTGDRRARRLNKAYRRKEYIPNILSFPLGPHEGEIILNLRKAEREAKKLRVPIRFYLAYLFIHGCLHLKGHTHGSTMDKAKKKWCEHFRIPYLS